MTNNTAAKIIQFIEKKKQATVHELVEYLGISRQATHRQLTKLLEKEKLAKLGKPPKVFYVLADETQVPVQDWTTYSAAAQLTSEQQAIIEDRYLYISPFGEMKTGADGFFYWYNKTGQPVGKTAHEYIQTIKKYDALKKNGVINGMPKFKSTFQKVHLDHIFYLDFYSIERFGKTKLGQLLLYAKQSQNKELMRQLVNTARPYIHNIIKQFRITAVGFIPPTVKRETQLVVEFAKRLQLTVPALSITKVTSDVAVPQKTLSKLDDRIENARRSIVVTEKKSYKNILLIDDAVGSGATFNETARKIKDQHICSGTVVGLSITGSYKGFDVISEV